MIDPAWARTARNVKPPLPIHSCVRGFEGAQQFSKNFVANLSIEYTFNTPVRDDQYPEGRFPKSQKDLNAGALAEVYCQAFRIVNQPFLTF
jgi:hypothetical protein